MSNGGIGPIPFSVRDFLGSAYYILTIIVVLLGLVSFMLSLKWRVDDLYSHEQERPTKADLREVAVKVEDRIHSLERRVEDLDVRGTRALADRTTLIEQENRSQSDRVQEIVKRMNTLQEAMNKLNNDLPVIVDRQNNNTRAVEELQRLLWGGGRSPVGPVGPGSNASPINQPQRREQ